MTREEYDLLRELLAHSGQDAPVGGPKDVFSAPPEPDDPPDGGAPPDPAPDSPPDSFCTQLEDRLDGLTKALWQHIWVTESLRDAVQALQKEQESKRSGEAVRQGRRARVYGFLAGVGIGLMALPLLSAAARLGRSLFHQAAEVLSLDPEVLSGGIVLFLIGLVALRVTKVLGRLFLGWLERLVSPPDEEDEELDPDDWEE